MTLFLPDHRGLLLKSTIIAENIISKETKRSVKNLYDISTSAEMKDHERVDGVFAQLMLFEPENAGARSHYRICLQDDVIFDFIDRNPDVDILSFITFIMTHELIHVHRFSTGMADFNCFEEDEEVCVDTLTRLFLAKNPVTGLKKILVLLDKVEAAPLYNERILMGNRRNINAYL